MFTILKVQRSDSNLIPSVVPTLAEGEEQTSCGDHSLRPNHSVHCAVSDTGNSKKNDLKKNSTKIKRNINVTASSASVKARKDHHSRKLCKSDRKLSLRSHTKIVQRQAHVPP